MRDLAHLAPQRQLGDFLQFGIRFLRTDGSRRTTLNTQAPADIVHQGASEHNSGSKCPMPSNRPDLHDGSQRLWKSSLGFRHAVCRRPAAHVAKPFQLRPAVSGRLPKPDRRLISVPHPRSDLDLSTIVGQEPSRGWGVWSWGGRPWVRDGRPR